MTLVCLEQLIESALLGQIVSFPTDTVPALAVLPKNSHLIYQLKQRELHKPLILMGANTEELMNYITGSYSEVLIWRAICKKYWPGALTLVLPASDRLPQAMNLADSTSIGIRVPNCKMAQEILSVTGPLATTSANRSGEPALLHMNQINDLFPHIAILKYTRDNSVEIGMPSTVIKWSNQGWELLRQGKITL